MAEHILNVPELHAHWVPCDEPADVVLIADDSAWSIAVYVDQNGKFYTYGQMPRYCFGWGRLVFPSSPGVTK